MPHHAIPNGRDGGDDQAGRPRSGGVIRSTLPLLATWVAAAFLGAAPVRAPAAPALPAVAAASATRQTDDATDQQIRAALVREQIPGAALLVMRDGAPLRFGTWGLANVELDVPVSRETMFESGSLGKVFTAAAVLLLVERGKVSLDDPITKYFPGAPSSWAGIRVRQLLDHTSGLHDSEEDGGEIFDLRREYSDAELVAKLQSYPLSYAPGTRWKYSNTGYILAGILITRVTGMFYGDFLAREIFRPLGMRTARIISDSQIVPHRAQGYLRTAHGLRNQDFASAALNATGDGSLYLSLEDWAKWIAAMDKGALLSPASWELLSARTRIAGKPTDHAFVWDYLKLGGREVMEFDGSWQGFRTAIERDPRSKLTVLLLTNLAQAEPVPLARDILVRTLQSSH
ncbi:MAG: beta-lactamase family protein [Proteobacteria bacterium]|nr:beta-lactamase family protein [Pseudomonadota bacterium]